MSPFTCALLHLDVLSPRMVYKIKLILRGRHGGLMVGALDSGVSGPGSSPGRGHCVVFLGKTLG